MATAEKGEAGRFQLQGVGALTPHGDSKDSDPQCQACSWKDACRNGISPESLANCLKFAVGTGNIEEIKAVVGNEVDPNLRVDFVRGHRTYVGTAISIAVYDGRRDVAQALFECKAAIDKRATCKYTVGASRVLMHAKPVNIAVLAGNLDELKMLAGLGAPLDKLTRFSSGEKYWEKGPSLLWQAAHHGHMAILAYLLMQPGARKHLETYTTNGDDLNLSHTPLHQAARMGRYGAVKLLIEANANFRSTNVDDQYCSMVTPLTDAIIHCHPRVVRLLIAESADLWNEETMDALFKKQNEVMILNAARGLEEAASTEGSTAFDAMEARHFVHFLESPGLAPVAIMRAVFPKRTLQYWEVRDLGMTKKTGVNIRRVVKTACLEDSWNRDGLRAAIGPSAELFANLMRPDLRKENIRLDPRQSEFIKELAPEPRKPGPIANLFGLDEETMVPVEVRQCILPCIHNNVGVLFAMANAGPKIYDSWGAKAIVLVGWKRAWRFWTFNFFMNMIITICFMFVTINIQPDATIPHSPLGGWIAIFLSASITLYNLTVEVLQIIGFAFLKARTSYYTFANLFDFLRIGLTISTVGVLALNWAPEGRNVSDHERFLLAITVFWRWCKVLRELRGFRWVGPKLLPILEALGEVWLFGLISFFPFAGFVHAYHALGIRNFDRSFVDMFRLGFLGDFDLDDLENVDGTWNQDPENPAVLTYEDPIHGFWSAPVRIVMIVCGVVLTISIMNIFVTVLGETFNRSIAKKEQLFLHERACMLRDYLAMHEVTDRILAACACFERAAKINPSGPGPFGGPTTDDFELEHIWLCSLDDLYDDQSSDLHGDKTETQVAFEASKNIAALSNQLQEMNKKISGFDCFVQDMREAFNPAKTRIP